MLKSESLLLQLSGTFLCRETVKSTNTRNTLFLFVGILLSGCLNVGKANGNRESVEAPPSSSTGSNIISLRCNSKTFDDGVEVRCDAVNYKREPLVEVPPNKELIWGDPTVMNSLPTDSVSCGDEGEPLSKTCFIEGEDLKLVFKMQMKVKDKITGEVYEAKHGNAVVGHQMFFVYSDAKPGNWPIGDYHRMCENRAIDSNLEAGEGLTWKALLVNTDPAAATIELAGVFDIHGQFFQRSGFASQVLSRDLYDENGAISTSSVWWGNEIGHDCFTAHVFPASSPFVREYRRQILCAITSSFYCVNRQAK